MPVNIAREIVRIADDEVRFVDFKFNGLASGETISSVSSTTVEPTGELTATNTSTSDNTVQYQIESGVSGRMYLVTIVVTTSTGQTLKACGKVQVGDCAGIS